MPTQLISRKTASNEKHPEVHNALSVMKKSPAQTNDESALDKIRLRIKMRKQEKVSRKPVHKKLPQSRNMYVEQRNPAPVEPPVKKLRIQTNGQRSESIVIRDDQFESQPVNELQYIQTTHSYDDSLAM